MMKYWADTMDSLGSKKFQLNGRCQVSSLPSAHLTGC